MARQKNNSTSSNGSSANLGFEAKLWLTAIECDKRRLGELIDVITTAVNAAYRRPCIH